LSSDIYYFAFGSNLNHCRLHQRIGEYKKVGIGYLADHKLAFNKCGGDGSGKCTVVLSAGNSVWGMICQINLMQKQQLDFFEGVGHGYDAVNMDVYIKDKTVNAILYQAMLDYHDDGLHPFDWYKDFVLSGAKGHQLPAEHVKMIGDVTSIKDPDIQRRELNQRILEGIY